MNHNPYKKYVNLPYTEVAYPVNGEKWDEWTFQLV